MLCSLQDVSRQPRQDSRLCRRVYSWIKTPLLPTIDYEDTTATIGRVERGRVRAVSA